MPDIFSFISPSVIYILMIFVFLSFLGVEIEKGLKVFYQNLGNFLFLFVSKLILLPLLLHWLSKLIIPKFSNGILILSATSTGVVAPFIGSIVGADITIILVMVVVTTLFLPISLPILVATLTDMEVSVSFIEMVKTLCFIILIPVSCAYLTRRCLSKLTSILLESRYFLSLFCLSLINLGVFSRYAHFFYQSSKVIFICIIVAICLGTFFFLAGYFGVFTSQKRLRLASCVSFVNINNVLIIVFGSKFFGPLEPTLAAMYMFPFFLAIIPLRWVSKHGSMN